MMRHSATVPCRHWPIREVNSGAGPSGRRSCARLGKVPPRDTSTASQGTVALVGEVEQGADLLEGEAEIPRAPHEAEPAKWSPGIFR